MKVIVSRSRIAGALPHYVYRALVPAEGVAVERIASAGTVHAPGVAGRIACIRIAPLIAPERYLAMRLSSGRRLPRASGQSDAGSSG